jgi:hypothetical protein
MVVPEGVGSILVSTEPPLTRRISVAVCGDTVPEPVLADSPVMPKKEVRSIDERVSYG